jgi:hypothetical protein
MKKDGIQTRNRKLSAKSKKKRGSVVDFFSPFDTKPFSAYSGMASSYLSSPMSQYYAAGAAMHGQMTSQFAGMYAPSSLAAAGTLLPPTAGPTSSFAGSSSSFGLHHASLPSVSVSESCPLPLPPPPPPSHSMAMT